MTDILCSGKETGYRETSYLLKVVEYFLKRRGRGLLLSPKDLDLAYRWKQAGIPLPVVLKGIASTFLRAGSRSSSIQFLAYCEPGVERSWEKFKRQRRGAPNQGNGNHSEAEKFLQRLTQIKEELQGWAREQAAQEQAKPKTELAGAALDIAGKLRGLTEDVQAGAEVGEALKGLRHLRELLTAEALKHLPAEELLNIKTAVRHQLQNYQQYMSREVYSETQNSLYGKLGLKYHGLPSLSIYGV